MSLDRKISIYEPVKTRTASGFEKDQYQLISLGEVYAQLKFGPGKETQEGKQVVSSNSYVFKIRYRADLKETFIIGFEGNYYDILGIMEEGRRRFLHITAEAKDNDRSIDIFTP